MLQRGFEFAPGYRLQEFLGRGQFGQVWRATAPGGTAAAVKFIDLTDGQGQKEYAGVKRVKQIRQANLMPITAIWLLDKDGKVIEEAPDEAVQTIELSEPHGADRTGMVVMPQVEPAWLVVAMLLGGKSLLQRLKECVGQGLPGIPPKELLSYMDDAAKGLDFLNDPRHDLGEGPVSIQHCDVKPANIVMIGTSAVVCDFGLARILTRNQITATSASGTPAYMAPEAISGKPSSTSDQYSLAVTYYHLRTGRLPVSDGTLWEVLEAHRRGQLNFDDVSPSEQAVLRKATALEWQDRFELNVDMVDALREALRHEGHTRPSFLAPGPASGDRPARTSGGSGQGRAGSAAPPADASAAAGSPAATADFGASSSEDPTATFDSELVSPSAASASGETATEIQAERPTAADIPRDVSPTPWFRRPKWIASAGVGAVLLAGVAFLISGSGDPDVASSGTEPSTTEQLGDSAGGSATEGKSPEQWLALAMGNLASDEALASEQFTSAIAADPSLAEVQPVVLSGHSDAVEKLLVTPSGDTLISVAYDPQPFAWPLGELSRERSVAAQADLDPVRLDGDNDLILYPEAVELSPDGKRLLSGGASGVVWALGQQDPSASPLRLPADQQEVMAVAWHPEGEFAVTASGGRIGLWQLTAGTSKAPAGTIADNSVFETTAAVRSLQFHPSGQWLVAVTQNGEALAFSWSEVLATLQLDSAPTPFPVKAEGTDARVVGFPLTTPETPQVAIGSSDGSVTLWEINRSIRQIDRVSPHNEPVESMQVVSDEAGGTVVTSASDGTVNVWDRGDAGATKTERLSDHPIPAVDVSPDGRWVAAAAYDGSVWLWKWTAERPVKTRLSTGTSMVQSVAIDPSGHWLVAGSGDGTIRLWDMRLVQLLALAGRNIDGESAPEELPEREVKVDPLAMRHRPARR